MIALNLAMTKGSITEEEYFVGIEELKRIPAQVEKVLEWNELVVINSWGNKRSKWYLLLR